MAAPPSPAPPVVRCGVVASTQSVAFSLAADGAEDRTVVVADHQTMGRGRRGHDWVDAPGESLLVSIVVRPRLPQALLPAVGLMTAVVVADALAALTDLAPRLKWPNDVLVRRRKVAGILVESRTTPTPVLVVGVGVNLNQTSLPPSLGGRATSVRLETGRSVDRDAALVAVVAGFDEWRVRLERQGFAPVRERWLALADTVGRRVTVDGVAGIAVGLDADGALLVEDGGAVRRVTAGEITESEVGDAPRR